MSVREVLVPGATLATECAGQGDPPLVLIHGLAGDRRAWDLVWRRLTNDRRVIRYDLRDFGASASLDEAEFRHSRDLEALLDALHVSQCDLAGVSLGGSIALNFTLDRPERVRRLSLISPGMTAWEWSEAWRALWRDIVQVAQARGVGEARELWFAHPLFATTRALPTAAEKFRETLWTYSGAVWTDGDREEPALPDLDRLPFLDTPTLLLTGKSDWIDFRVIADLIESAAPSVHRVDYEAAGHMLNLERPTEVANEILKFIA